MTDIPLHDVGLADLGLPAEELPSSNYDTSSAFSSSAYPDEDWTKISDLAERTRIRNRIAQRNYRKKIKRRLEELEGRAGSEENDAGKQPSPDHGPETQPLQQQQQLSSVAWSLEDDQLLLITHMLGLTWTEIRDQYLQSKTPDACSKRHEWLIEQRVADSLSSPKMQTLAKEYMSMREEIWSGLAARIGEEWSVVEEKCMHSDPESLQSATHAAEGRVRMIKEYMSMRKEVWSGLAARIQEQWSVVEEKCISKGLNRLQRVADIVEKRAKLNELKSRRQAKLLMRNPTESSVDGLVSSLLFVQAGRLPSYPYNQGMWEESTVAPYINDKQPSKDLQDDQVSIIQQPIHSTKQPTPHPADNGISGKNTILPCVDDKQPSKGLGRQQVSPTGTIRHLLSWIRKISRPRLKLGYRRIEWTCDCGVDLYGDFVESKTSDLDDLEVSLHTPAESTNISSDSEQSVQTQTNTRRHMISRSSSSSKTALSTDSTDVSSIDIIQPKFLALCVNTGGMYKTLAELDTSRINSDGEAFSQMKKAYLQYRGVRSRLRFLIKPVTVEFVRFTLWNLRHGYVSVCDRPNSMPPNTRIDYDFITPPMPPEVFVHYLEHGDGDLSPNRYTWLPRLPKRLNNKVIDCGEATEGWGIHIIEGPNRETVFWILMVTILASVLSSVLWTTLRGDIQGGTGLGALIVALPPAILAAFLFRLGVR